MTPEERERFYDEDVAPALAELCRHCAAAGISILTLAELRPEALGRTAMLLDGHGQGIALANTAAGANGNPDALIRALIADAQANGHSSIYLFQLGIPFDPVAAGTG
ncbi:MAG: hypothetical protein DI547_01585 [Sphingobium sp.]|nr:MAG: hypothetical protein DI547_01585 [Sphingobium sp.]